MKLIGHSFKLSIVLLLGVFFVDIVALGWINKSVIMN